MFHHDLVFSIFLIFLGAAILSTIALFARQSMLIAYMALGILLGPWGFKWIGDPDLVQHVGDVGIIFLLFLLGLHLPPQKLIHMLKKMCWVGLISSLLFALWGYGITWLLGYKTIDCIVVGTAMMFSSTIIGIKLLPTTTLHHQHTGEIMISILLLQDLLAIVALLFLGTLSSGGTILNDILLAIISFVALLFIAYLLEKFVLNILLAKFNRIKEYVFMLTIAWCLTMAELANYLGLSHEIGAFIAGVSLAASPISLYIAESLKPVRDFFLVMFFFSVGAKFNLDYFNAILLAALLITSSLLILKPIIYRFLLQQVGEASSPSWEVGVRLGQISEFSLIIVYSALDHHLISYTAACLIQAVTILSFVISSYWVVMYYPTPLALTDRLRKD